MNKLPNEVIKILQLAEGAINKIQVERTRGASYYHAEVDWLIQQEEEIQKILLEQKEIKE
jgi:hypothetical protein